MPRWLLLLPLLCSTALWAETNLETHSYTLPPASLAKWYKPANERQVWLHTMFGLRRAMQATAEYAALGDGALTKKWAERLVKDYKRLPEMVPEWRDEIELKAADQLLAAANKGDMNGVNGAMRKLGTSCRSCHNEYRAIAHLVYRTPDYHAVKVENSETLEEVPYMEAMERLSTLMNRIKIAQEDGRNDAARDAGTTFTTALKDLERSCSACHKDDDAPRARIFDPAQPALTELASGLQGNDGKQVDKALGTLGAFTCGRCHGVHRTTAWLRHALIPHRH